MMRPVRSSATTTSCSPRRPRSGPQVCCCASMPCSGRMRVADFHELKRTIGQYSGTNWDDTLHRMSDAFDDMQRRWPRKVDFSGLLADSAIAVFPLLFVEGFGHVEPARLE